MLGYDLEPLNCNHFLECVPQLSHLSWYFNCNYSDFWWDLHGFIQILSIFFWGMFHFRSIYSSKYRISEVDWLNTWDCCNNECFVLNWIIFWREELVAYSGLSELLVLDITIESVQYWCRWLKFVDIFCADFRSDISFLLSAILNYFLNYSLMPLYISSETRDC